MRERLEHLADAGHAGPAAAQAEGDVGAEPAGGDEVVAAGPPQHGGGVGRAAAEAAAGGDPLVDVHGGRAPDGAQRLAHEVGVVGRTPAANGPEAVSSSPRPER